MDKELDSIIFLNGYSKIKEIFSGHSSAKKFLVTKNNKKYFVKITNYDINKNIDEILTNACVPHPKIYEIGRTKFNNNYIIEEYIDGENFKEKICKIDKKFVYEYGFKIGQAYHNLITSNPSKIMDEKNINLYNTSFNNYIKLLSDELQIYNSSISPQNLAYINKTKKYVLKNFNIRQDLLYYGNTDFKFSNFIIDKHKNIIAIDIENTEYCNLIHSVRYCINFDSVDNFKKSLVFINGYFDGLFQFDVPKKIYKSFKTIFYLMFLNFIANCLKNKNIDEFNFWVNYFKNNFILKTTKSKKLLNFAFFIKEIGFLKNYKFTLQNGSYSSHNLVFICEKNNCKYILKLMSGSLIKNNIIANKILIENNIPTYKIYKSGKLKSNNRSYYLIDYIPYKQIDKFFKPNNFSNGFKLGEKVGQEFKKIANLEYKEFSKFSIDNFCNEIFKNVEIFFKNDNLKHLFNKIIGLTKPQLIILVNNLKKSFNLELFHLIHEDLKPANILFDGKNKLCFVDNESFIYSYDIMNFRWNIQAVFLKDAKTYQGYVSGYISTLNNGKIPNRIHEQIKLLILFLAIDNIKRVYENKLDAKKLNVFKPILNEILKNKKIGWLKNETKEE